MAGPDDLQSALHIDSTAFGLDPEENRRWLEPLLSARAGGVRAGALDGAAAGTAYVLRSDGARGAERLPRRRGGAAGGAAARGRRGRLLVAAGARRSQRGAELAHLNPDTDAAARIYERLGFTELPGHDIYIELL